MGWETHRAIYVLSLWYYNAEGFTQLEQLLIERLLINRSMETSLCRRSFCHSDVCVIRFPNKEIGIRVLPNSFCFVHRYAKLHEWYNSIRQNIIISNVKRAVLNQQLCYCIKDFYIIYILYFSTQYFHLFKRLTTQLFSYQDETKIMSTFTLLAK